MAEVAALSEGIERQGHRRRSAPRHGREEGPFPRLVDEVRGSGRDSHEDGLLRGPEVDPVGFQDRDGAGISLGLLGTRHRQLSRPSPLPWFRGRRLVVVIVGGRRGLVEEHARASGARHRDGVLPKLSYSLAMVQSAQTQGFRDQPVSTRWVLFAYHLTHNITP